MSQVRNRGGSDFIILSPFCFYVEQIEEKYYDYKMDAFHSSNILNAFTGHRFAFCSNIAMEVLGRWGLYFWLVLPFYFLSIYPMRSYNNPVLATQKLCISSLVKVRPCGKLDYLHI